MSELITELNQTPFGKFREIFSNLQIPEPASLIGVYQASFVGPAWLRTSADPALALSGLGGWWGKEFFENGTAINIILKGGIFSNRFSMKLISTPSFIDRQAGLYLHYQPGNPFPWMYVVDEIRQLDQNNLLGMTMANVTGLRGLAFPFLLQKSEKGTGK